VPKPSDGEALIYTDILNLILLERNEVNDAGRVALSDGRADHIRRVLRATPGQQLRIGIVDGPCGVASVAAVAGDAVVLQCLLDSTVPPAPRVDLLLALPRPKVMRRLWAQLAAIGVGQILLTNAERVERNYFDTHVLEPESYRPLLLEGLQQARDTRLPSVSIHRQFKILVDDRLDDLCPTALRLVADPSVPTSISTIVRARAPEHVLLAIGPEGGWNSSELDRLGARGFQMVSLGSRTLRTDTAAVALLAIVHAALNG
jgi:RsmE family RNA methyltransferase